MLDLLLFQRKSDYSHNDRLMGVSIPENPDEHHVARIRHSATANPALGASLSPDKTTGRVGLADVIARRTTSGRRSLAATLQQVAAPRFSDPGSVSHEDLSAGAAAQIPVSRHSVAALVNIHSMSPSDVDRVSDSGDNRSSLQGDQMGEVSGSLNPQPGSRFLTTELRDGEKGEER